jgi:hypothetical protein
MNQRVEGGHTITICPHCKRDISGRVLIIYRPLSDGDERPVWHCQECRREWPTEPAITEQEG